MIQHVDFKIKDSKTKRSYFFPVQLLCTHKRIFFKFGFNRAVMEEIKQMQGCQWHGYEDAPFRDLPLSVWGTDKVWSCLDNCRNRFQLDFLYGKNPYGPWDKWLKEPIKLEFQRPLYDHQKDLVTHAMMVHYGIWAAEMGTGKTLAAIEVMERSGFHEWWYVAPKSALKAVERDFMKWDLKINPTLMTYNSLVKEMKHWLNGRKAPRGVFFDESQRVKTPGAQRSDAALGLANGVREDWGMKGYAILMSGSPAPKAPVDWWHQAEVACPGFLKEGTINKFRFRLGLHEQKESFAGGSYLERLTWLDNPEKCAVCGELKLHPNHDQTMTQKWHPWKESINEVEKLYRRLHGLTVVKLKKDCIDLPEKQYRIIECPPIPSMIRTAKLISASSTTVAKALTRLRELSDGFQYVEKHTGDRTCDLCHGSLKMKKFQIKPDHAGEYENGLLDDTDLTADQYQDKYFDEVEVTCTRCAGSGLVAEYSRDVERVPCPKDDIFKDLLDEHSDCGRLVVYAGFTGSVDRCVEIALGEKWAVVKWDGSGLEVWNADGTRLRVRAKTTGLCGIDIDGAVEPLTMFQDDFENFPRVCFIGNAGAAGTGLTLTASPSIFYFSNSFNADDRIQSEDRIHRIGMDVNRGATIIDVFHLPTDKYVYDNIRKKRLLQDISMGELESIFAEKKPEPLIKVR